MSSIFGHNVDFNYNETLKQRFENQLTFPTLNTSQKGFVFFHTANEKFYGWNGATWLDFSAGGGGSGLANIVEDTTPQLGGNLDMQGFGIESTAGGSVFSLLSTSGNRRAKSVWVTNEIYSPVNFSGLTTPTNPGSLSADFTTGEWTIGANRILTTLDLGSFVTTNTSQTITGFKTFSGGVVIDDSLAFIKKLSNITSASQGVVYFKTDNTFNVSVGTGVGAHNATFSGIDSFTAARSFTLQDKSGTLAHLDDLPSISEGTFTPAIVDTGGGATYSITTSECKWYKIGKVRHVVVRLEGISKTGTATGQLNLTGMPGNPDGFQTAYASLSGSGVQHSSARVVPVSSIWQFLRKVSSTQSQELTFPAPDTISNFKINFNISVIETS